MMAKIIDMTSSKCPLSIIEKSFDFDSSSNNSYFQLSLKNLHNADIIEFLFNLKNIDTDETIFFDIKDIEIKSNSIYNLEKKFYINDINTYEIIITKLTYKDGSIWDSMTNNKNSDFSAPATKEQSLPKKTNHMKKWIIALVMGVIMVTATVISQENSEPIQADEMINNNESDIVPVAMWQSNNGVPIGTYAGGFVSCNGALYSVGGSSSRDPLLNNYQYDPTTGEWIKKASMKTTHKNGAYVSSGGKIHVIAGDPFSNVHEVYDPVKDEWTQLAPIPTRVQHVMGVTVNDKIYVMGGLENWSTVSNKNQVYDIKSDSWGEMAPMPMGKHGYSAIVHNEKIYIFGSLVYDSIGREGIFGSNPSIEVYDTKADTWESIGNMPTNLYLGAIVVYGDDVIIIGGFRDKDEPEALVDIFSLETYSWRKGIPIPTPFVGMGAVEYKDQLYVAGGADSLKKWSTNGNLFQIPIKTLLENSN